MASKEIFICDKCGSFVDESNVFSVTLAIGDRQGNKVQIPTLLPLGGQKDYQKREICRSCVELLIDDFSLVKTRLELMDELFKDVGLPKRLESVDPRS